MHIAFWLFVAMRLGGFNLMNKKVCKDFNINSIIKGIETREKHNKFYSSIDYVLAPGEIDPKEIFIQLRKLIENITI